MLCFFPSLSDLLMQTDSDVTRGGLIMLGKSRVLEGKLEKNIQGSFLL